MEFPPGFEEEEQLYKYCTTASDVVFVVVLDGGFDACVRARALHSCSIDDPYYVCTSTELSSEHVSFGWEDYSIGYPPSYHCSSVDMYCTIHTCASGILLVA